MLKLCATSISKSSQILYKNFLVNECFQVWKRVTSFLFIKKTKKTIDLSCYCLFLLEFLKKYLIYYANIWMITTYLNSNQSGFCPGDSWVHQLLTINNIYKAFKTNPSLEVRGVFLGLSKVFDRVWHAELMYKLQ